MTDLATELLKAIENEYPGIVDIADVFTYSTILTMACIWKSFKDSNKINEFVEHDRSSLSIEEVFKKLELGEISPKEADELINNNNLMN